MKGLVKGGMLAGSFGGRVSTSDCEQIIAQLKVNFCQYVNPFVSFVKTTFLIALSLKHRSYDSKVQGSLLRLQESSCQTGSLKGALLQVIARGLQRGQSSDFASSQILQLTLQQHQVRLIWVQDDEVMRGLVEGGLLVGQF